jgi:hypothetical protein
LSLSSSFETLAASTGWAASAREAVTLGMDGYLAGVVAAPADPRRHSDEITCEPGLVGPLQLCTLIARRASHALARA